MPRQSRLDYSGCYHHVMGRGIDGLKIFSKEADKQDFLSRLKQLQKELSLQIHAWCIMDNHFHLLYQTGKNKLSTFMRKLLTGYAINYNKRNKRRGYLFQNRYKSIIIEVDEYYLPLVRYIHLNPVKANIVNLAQLKEYAWTGHKEIMTKQKESVIDGETVLSYFGRNRREALKKYEEYLADGIEKNDNHLLGGGLIRSVGGLQEAVKIRRDEKQIGDERILGGGDFVEEILKRCEQEEPLESEFKDVDSLLCKISKLYNVDQDALIEMRTKEVRKARSIFLYLAVKRLGKSVKDAGKVLGIKESAASIGVRRGMMFEREKGVIKRLLA